MSPRDAFQLEQIGTPPPEDQYLQVTSFAGGYDLRDAPEDALPGSSPDMLDMEIAQNDRLIRAPGITVDEALGNTPNQMILHAGTEFSSELLMIAGSKLGIKTDGATAWYDLGLRGNRWAWANFAGVLLLTDGISGLFYRKSGQTVITAIPNSNVGQAITVFAGRVILGGVVATNGDIDLMTIAYSAADSDFADWTGEGAEQTPLIGSMQRADRIQAFGSIGFNQLGVICRRSLWIGVPTGDVFQPIEFTPRIEDTGCVRADTVVTTEFGVLFLSDDGVRLFDGTNAQLVSDQINSDLLPIVEGNLYFATFDPTAKRYYLCTYKGIYILDLLRKRWYKWSSIVSAASFFPVQGAASVSWDAAVGSWDAQALAWDQLASQETGGSMMFTQDQNLGHADPAATAAFGIATIPHWLGGRLVGENQDSLMLHLQAQLTYEADADSVVEIWLPKTRSGDFEAVQQQLLPASGASTGRSLIPFIHSGRGVGFGMRVLSGFPRIRRASVRYQVTDVGEGADFSTVTDFSGGGGGGGGAGVPFSITLPPTLDIVALQTGDINAVVRDSLGNILGTPVEVWASNDAGVATVAGTGDQTAGVTGVISGTCIIHASITSAGVSSNGCAVTVDEAQHVHHFANGDTFHVDIGGMIHYAIVAGGGDGDSALNGGGGGQVKTGIATVISGQDYAIEVGGPGAFSRFGQAQFGDTYKSDPGSNGDGHHGGQNGGGGPGGGSGAGYSNPALGLSGSAGGGGGGAGGAGGDALSSPEGAGGGSGGAPAIVTVGHTPRFFAGGGGGGCLGDNVTPGEGGEASGGAGGFDGDGSPAQSETGGGGGGPSGSGAGGSLYVWYGRESGISATGGVETDD